MCVCVCVRVCVCMWVGGCVCACVCLCVNCFNFISPKSSKPGNWKHASMLRVVLQHEKPELLILSHLGEYFKCMCTFKFWEPELSQV